ncbi:MAG: signal transduction protein [Pseudomonadota bacterium]
MNKLSQIGISILLVALLSGCVTGPDRRPQPGSERGGTGQGFEGQVAKPIALLFVSMDRNQNGQTDHQELIAGISREWARLSSERAVGALEYAAWAATTFGAEDALPSFISFDRDLNGGLSQIEFDDRLRAEFVELDKNGDGVIDRSELIFRVTRPSREQRGTGRGQRGSGGQEGSRPPRRS